MLVTDADYPGMKQRDVDYITIRLIDDLMHLNNDHTPHLALSSTSNPNSNSPFTNSIPTRPFSLLSTPCPKTLSLSPLWLSQFSTVILEHHRNLSSSNATSFYPWTWKQREKAKAKMDHGCSSSLGAHSSTVTSEIMIVSFFLVTKVIR